MDEPGSWYECCASGAGSPNEFLNVIIPAKMMWGTTLTLPSTFNSHIYSSHVYQRHILLEKQGHIFSKFKCSKRKGFFLFWFCFLSTRLHAHTHAHTQNTLKHTFCFLESLSFHSEHTVQLVTGQFSVFLDQRLSEIVCCCGSLLCSTWYWELQNVITETLDPVPQ